MSIMEEGWHAFQGAVSVKQQQYQQLVATAVALNRELPPPTRSCTQNCSSREAVEDSIPATAAEQTVASAAGHTAQLSNVD